MAALVKIKERNGWLYACVPRTYGCGRSLLKPLRTKSMEEAKQIVKDSNLEQIALASRADALTRDVWTRLLAGRKVSCLDAMNAYRERKTLLGSPAPSCARSVNVVDQLLRATLIGNEVISTLETRHISRFVNAPGAQSLRTRQFWLDTLNGWLNYCVEQRWILTNPAAEVVLRIDGLTQEQLISKPYVPFTDDEVAIACDRDLARGQPVVDEPLPDDVVAWLDEWKAHRPVSDTFYLFPCQAAIASAGESLLSCQFGRLLTKHGIEGKSFHSLRKTAAINRWSAELEELGDKDRRSLMNLRRQERLACGAKAFGAHRGIAQ